MKEEDLDPAVGLDHMEYQAKLQAEDFMRGFSREKEDAKGNHLKGL